ncbi:hypothetical protein MHH28_05105 [Paenibacillus sp. FSL K6-1217]|uniref:hypothetical protein n=1 Tax=Paenibacillus sp. FSL K6-1217 TaxID=2921466 RepID=UPI003250D84F
MLNKAMDTLEFLSQDAAAQMAYDVRMKALSDERIPVLRQPSQRHVRDKCILCN